MAKLNLHHISYDPEWTVDLPWTVHKSLWPYQKAKATEERYRLVTNIMHAWGEVWQRMRRDLDVEGVRKSPCENVTDEK